MRYDALIVFSEGHIKCLGLAILLAKNIAQGCPVVIFDDVVNAIDDDRDGIWRTFFEDGLLDGKQVILYYQAWSAVIAIHGQFGANSHCGAVHHLCLHPAGRRRRRHGWPSGRSV